MTMPPTAIGEEEAAPSRMYVTEKTTPNGTAKKRPAQPTHDRSIHSEDLTAAPSEQERAELAEVLFKCSGPFKRTVSAMLPWPAVLSFLSGELRECRLATRSQEECLHAFVMRMEEPTAKAFLDDLQRRIRADPASFGGVDGCVKDDWIEQFQQQVDYVPGISKGKKLIDEEVMGQYLELGLQMKKGGNEHFAKMDFEFALMRCGSD